MGSWKLLVTGPSVEHSLTLNSETNNGNQITKEFAWGMQQTMKTSYIGSGFGGSFTYGFNEYWSSSQTVSTEITTGQSETIKVACNNEVMGLKTKGNWNLWQWTLHRPDLYGRLGFTSYTRHFYCTNSLKPPQYPPSECGGRMCYVKDGSSN